MDNFCYFLWWLKITSEPFNSELTWNLVEFIIKYLKINERLFCYFKKKKRKREKNERKKRGRFYFAAWRLLFILGAKISSRSDVWVYPIILYCVKSTRMKRTVLRWWVWEGILSLSLPDALQEELNMLLLQDPCVKLSENGQDCKYPWQCLGIQTWNLLLKSSLVVNFFKK